MYAMPKIHISNNILAKTRRGLPQKLETFEKNLKENTQFLINAPKPVFHFSNTKKLFHEDSQQEKLTPQHEEMVKYIQSSWSTVIEQYESKVDSSNLNSNKLTTTAPTATLNTTTQQQNNVPKISYFTSKTATIPKFEPFDLESFWSDKIYQKLISA